MPERWRSATEGWSENAKVRVSAVGARQFGRVARRQLEVLGVGNATIGRWLREAYLHTALPGVFAVGHRAPSVEADLAAAILYAGPGAMLSHATAAWWLALIDSMPSIIAVSTPRRCVSVPGIRVHERRRLHRVIHRGLPATPVAQTLLDYAATAPRHRVRRALAEAEYRRLLDLDGVAAVLGRGRPGSARLRTSIESHRPELAVTRSVLEERFLALCEGAAIPLPEVNVSVMGLMVDFLWREQRVIVEVDGRAAHGTTSQKHRDHERDLVLRHAAYVVLRYSWRQITRQGLAVSRDVQTAVSRSAPSA